MRRRVPHSVERGQLVSDACAEFTLASYRPNAQERIERALARLTEEERKFVLDLEAGLVTEQGCLIELIERRFGPYDATVTTVWDD